MLIDERAIVDPSAVLAEDVQVGPWSIIGPGVEIGAGTVVGPHVIIKGPTRIGRNNRIYQFSSVGEDTPDLKYKGEPTRLEIGDNNVIREGVTIHRGTVQDKGVTIIGNDNLLMAYVHVGHDSVIGNHRILVNNLLCRACGNGRLIHFVRAYPRPPFCKIGAHSFRSARRRQGCRLRDRLWQPRRGQGHQHRGLPALRFQPSYHRHPAR